MTIEITVKCDGDHCFNDREIEADTDAQVERIGWVKDHKYGGHYCPACWKTVKKELAEEGS